MTRAGSRIMATPTGSAHSTAQRREACIWCMNRTAQGAHRRDDTDAAAPRINKLNGARCMDRSEPSANHSPPSDPYTVQPCARVGRIVRVQNNITSVGSLISDAGRPGRPFVALSRTVDAGPYDRRRCMKQRTCAAWTVATGEGAGHAAPRGPAPAHADAQQGHSSGMGMHMHERALLLVCYYRV
jgi:hypothetical protein